MVRLNTTNWNDFVSAFPQVESRLIGFDRVFDAVTKLHTVEGGQSNSFPPYNIKKLDAENYEIQIALAGFSKSELNISVEDGNLVVKGEQEKSEDEFLHKGIAERNFTRTWALADDVKVTGSKLKDGVLTISLVHEIPEEKKPTSIEIK
jgi:molecular chaperone IbpA|tara:strand:- start:3539 stop:3985 length:447 start_codon:yes stop_codon:yes gene_type:complete